MTERLSVRRYEPRDAEAVWRVHEAALRASPLPFVEDAPADSDLRTVEATYLGGRGEFLVGLVESAVVATGGYLPADDSTAELRRMRVDPDWQGRGFGATILAALEDRARADGFETAVLETNEVLRTARSLYESRGYEEVDRRTDQAIGHTFVTYRKPL